MARYLVILPNNLGDVIMVLPVLEALKRVNEAHVTFFVEEGFEGGVMNSTFYDELFLFSRKGIKNQLRSKEWHSGIKQLSVSVKKLQDLRFDVIINLCQHGYVGIIVGLLETGTLLGRHFLRDGCHAISDLWSRYLYAVPFSRRCNNLHAIDVYKYIAQVNGVYTQGLIKVTDNEYQSAIAFLKESGRPDTMPIVVIQPGAAYQSKMWPVENYISLIKKLIDTGMWVVITGSTDEVVIAEGIRQHVPGNCTVACGKLTFRESVALVSAADICVTGDTAMMHAASALNKKIYALFGPTSPVETGPYGEGHVVFAGKCESRPCFCFECKTKICMKSINPQTVFEMITTGSVAGSSCDIYVTSFDEHALYRLTPLIEQGAPYVNVMYSNFTRKAFDPQYDFPVGNKSEYALVEEECIFIIEQMVSMELELELYIRTNDVNHIRIYENLRVELGKKKGIAEFFTAVLNIGLNSIPIINPIYAIKQSIKECQQVRILLTGAVNRAV